MAHERRENIEGVKGGSVEAIPTRYYRGEAQVRPALFEMVDWGPVWSGFVTALGTQLLLESLIVAIILSSTGTLSSTALAITTLVVSFVSLLAGSFVTARDSDADVQNSVFQSVALWGLVATLTTAFLIFAYGNIPILRGVAGPVSRYGNAWWYFVTLAAALIGALIGGGIGSRQAMEMANREDTSR